MTKIVWQLGIACGAQVALLALLPAYGDLSGSGHASRWVAIFLAAGLAYALALQFFGKMDDTARPAWLFWGVAVGLRLAVFPMPPADDMWRYLWEGRIQLHGFNPYLLNPQAAELEPLRDAVWARINHPDWASIYPPGAQFAFAALAGICESPWFFKLVFTLADLAGVALLLRLNGGDHKLTAWYAWNPLVVCSFAGSGHYDSLMILPLIAAIYCIERRESANENSLHAPRSTLHVTAASAALGIAIALKVVPLFLLPALALALRKRAGWLALAGVIPWLLTLPFGGWDVVKKPLTEFTHVTRFNDLVWWLVEATVWPNPWQRNERYTLVLGIAVAVIAMIFRHHWRRAALWSLGAALILSPVLHPWYLTWILPIACWRRAAPWFVLSITVTISLLVWEAGPFWGAWQMTWPLRLAVALPPLLTLLVLKNRSSVSTDEPAHA